MSLTAGRHSLSKRCLRRVAQRNIMLRGTLGCAMLKVNTCKAYVVPYELWEGRTTSKACKLVRHTLSRASADVMLV